MKAWISRFIIDIKKFTPMQTAAHLAAWSLLGWLAWDIFQGNLSVNPIQEITQRTGRYAIWLLVASLACTPLNTLFGLRQAISARRALGLYGFMFAALHFLTFSGLDYQFNLKLLQGVIFEKRFVIVGSIAFLILLALALTSTRGWQKRLGRNWKRLHQLFYAASVLVVIHYAWAVKGDITRLQGDILKPLVAAALVAVLLSLRIPFIRRGFIKLRKPLNHLTSKKTPASAKAGPVK
jgi:sulfoxide reductase heme-binding subunit YedZ